MDDEEEETLSPRMLGPLPFVLLLLRVPLLISLVLIAVLSDLAIPGSMREALRYAVIDQPHQLFVIGVALVLACAAIRFTGEATIELVAPEFYGGHHEARRIALMLPRILSLALGVAVGVSIFQLAIAGHGLSSPEQRLSAEGAGLSYVLLSLFIAWLPTGAHKLFYETREPTFLARWGLALIPLLLAIAFAGSVLGLWRSGGGTAAHALERYVSAFAGAVSDPTMANNALEGWVRGPTGAPILRYAPYVRSAPHAASTLSPLLIAAELASLFVACLFARLATAVLLDVVFPFIAHSSVGRPLRRLLPPLVSLGLGLAVAGQLLSIYLAHGNAIRLSRPETFAVWGIAALYVALAGAASLGAGSAFVDEGPWHMSSSVGRRFFGAARRLSSLDPSWQWYIRGILVFGIATFLLFADLKNVDGPQWIGPVAIILMWGATAAALFFPFAYLSHMVRIPLLTILLIAAVTFAGFNLNDNHELRTVDTPAAHPEATHVDRRQDLDLAAWIANRADWDKYEHYPVFIVATEGGGIRAAYFTATVLAAIQERCPAFAQHTLAISGVSGGSLGAGVFAALAADHAKNVAGPDCNIDGLKGTGPIVARARSVLSADLLSPLLGATLFPDALQRVIPVPIPSFDRARALEYTVETSWKNATPGKCATCDANRMAEKALDMYGRVPPRNAVPHLFLNTTEAGTGQIIPYATVRVLQLATPFRGQAEIDEDSLDSTKPALSQIERLSLQDRMLDDNIPLSTATIVSARFPYLTPAGSVGYSGGHYVDGGYFENSGTWLVSGLVQNLIGQQLSYPTAGADPSIEAARKAVFIVIVIQSEPCTRESVDNGCDEDATTADDSWSELLSPLRALLSTRNKRAEYSYDGLGALSALIEQLSPTVPATATTKDRDLGCDYPVCAVTLRFRNHTRTEIPLSWLLSSPARQSMDNAVDGLESANVRQGLPPTASVSPDDTQDIDRVLGSYRRVLCVLAARRDSTGCTPAQQQTSRR